MQVWGSPVGRLLQERDAEAIALLKLELQHRSTELARLRDDLGGVSTDGSMGDPQDEATTAPKTEQEIQGAAREDAQVCALPILFQSFCQLWRVCSRAYNLNRLSQSVLSEECVASNDHFSDFSTTVAVAR